ncbi:Lipid A export ATP-binding/permease protein MsbA [Rickettsiales bacterium Ac37b]|nr:Lipid A export ATP-binding/permease protein MsbA [Rickettsiales bacterium Ac37b]
MSSFTVHDYSNTYLIKRLIKYYIKPQFKKLTISIICMIIVAITSALHVWMIQPALDQIFLNKNQQLLVYIPIAVILLAVIKGGATYLQNYFMKYVGQRIVTNLQSTLYEHLVYSDLEFLQKQSSGKLISRFTNDIITMRGAVSNILTGIAKELITVVFLVALMIYQEPILSFIAFIVFPVAVIPVIRLGKRMRKISYKTQEHLGEYTAKLDDTFQAMRVIKSYQREQFEIDRAQNILEQIFHLYTKAIRTEALSSPIMETLSGIAIASVIWYGGMQVIDGHTSPGSFFSFIVAFIAAYKPLKTLTDLNTNLQEGLTSARRLFSILDSKPKIINAPDATPLNVIHGRIIFNNVSFAYPNGSLALDSVHLEMLPGKTIALVGLSGSGKSTIMNLLLRFYAIKEGSITIDYQDINTVTLESLRDSISLVSQDIMLFDDSIYANIQYGNLNATKKEIVDAAKAADIHDFIISLPEGYNSLIGQHGNKLSGGQRQRISIARAILKNSSILLLDEATSSLDPITEFKIHKALAELNKHRTTIIIAHRLSTIIDADLIYVMKHGKVIEYGNHQQLLFLNGEYSTLYKTYIEQEKH